MSWYKSATIRRRVTRQEDNMELATSGVTDRPVGHIQPLYLSWTFNTDRYPVNSTGQTVKDGSQQLLGNSTAATLVSDCINLPVGLALVTTCLPRQMRNIHSPLWCMMDTFIIHCHIVLAYSAGMMIRHVRHVTVTSASGVEACFLQPLASRHIYPALLPVSQEYTIISVLWSVIHLQSSSSLWEWIIWPKHHRSLNIVYS